MYSTVITRLSLISCNKTDPSDTSLSPDCLRLPIMAGHLPTLRPCPACDQWLQCRGPLWEKKCAGWLCWYYLDLFLRSGREELGNLGTAPGAWAAASEPHVHSYPSYLLCFSCSHHGIAELCSLPALLLVHLLPLFRVLLVARSRLIFLEGHL